MANDLPSPALTDANGNYFAGAVDPATGHMHPLEAGTTTAITGSATSATTARLVIELKDGGDATQGAQADAAYTGSGGGSIIALLKGLYAKLAGVLTVTANAGTNLNTSALALESGGNLAAAKTDLDAISTNTSGTATNTATTATNVSAVNTTLGTTNTTLGNVKTDLDAVKTSLAALNDATTSGNLTADSGGAPVSQTVSNTSAVVLALGGGQATALFNVTGAWVGTINWYASGDGGATYQLLTASTLGSATAGTSTAANGDYRANIAACTHVAAVMHPYTSGTATVRINASAQPHNVVVNNATPLGQAASASSAPVVIASDQIVPTQGNKTVIAGQGTGVVNGINTFLIPATDVSTYRWLSLQIAGTFTLSLVFEASNDNTNWFNVPLTSVSNAPVTNYFTSSTGFIYDGPVLFNYFRVRVSSYTSNSSLAGTLLLLTTPPVNQPYAPVTSYLGTRNWGGTLNTHLVTAATTNALNIRASATQLFRAEVGNNSATDCWLHFFNKATTPTPGTDSAIKSIYVPKGTRQFYENNIGLYAFTSGMGITVTGGSGVTDNTATTAGITVDVEYI